MCLKVYELKFKKSDTPIEVWKIIRRRTGEHVLRTLYQGTPIPEDGKVTAGSTKDRMKKYEDYNKEYDITYITTFYNKYNVYSGIVHCFKYKNDAAYNLKRYLSDDDCYSGDFRVVKVTIPAGTLYIEGIFDNMLCYGAKAVQYDVDELNAMKE